MQILEYVFRSSCFSTSEEVSRWCCVTIKLHGVTCNKDVLLSELLSHLMTQFRRRFRWGRKISIIWVGKYLEGDGWDILEVRAKKKEVDKQTAFIPVHSLAYTSHKKKLVNARENEMRQFPPTSLGATTPSEFHDHGHTTLGRTSLDEWSARHRGLYLASHNTHKRQISMPPAGFTPEIPTSERSQTYTLDRPATGLGGNESKWKQYELRRV